MPHILAIDDEPAITRLIRRFLEEAGHTVDTATNGREASVTFFTNRPDLIVVDTLMPKNEGIQFVNKIQEYQVYKEIPVITLHPKSNLWEDMERLRSSGENYLVKPFWTQELNNLVTEVLAAKISDGHEAIPPRILAVDDDPDVLRFIQLTLESDGYLVETAVNGVEALAKLRANRPRVMLFDVAMPEMDGWELLRIVRSDPILSVLPVILFSHKSTMDSRVIDLHPDMFLMKPFSARELKAFVAHILVPNH